MYMLLTSFSEMLRLKEALQGRAHQVGDKTRALTGPLSGEEVPEVATFKPDRGRLEELGTVAVSQAQMFHLRPSCRPGNRHAPHLPTETAGEMRSEWG